MKKKRPKKIQKGRLVFFLVFFVSILILNLFQPKSILGPKITIHSPISKTYYEKNIILKVSISEDVYTNDTALWIANSFDQGPNITECYNCIGYTRFDLFFEKGVHTITIYASDKQARVSKASITFIVDV